MKRSEKRRDEMAEAVNEMKNEVEGVKIETKNSAVGVEISSNPQNFLSQAQEETNGDYVTCQVRMDGIPEAILEEESSSKVDQESAKLQEILSHLDESPVIKDFQRLGRIAKRDTRRPRTVLMTLSSPWQVRKVLAKAKQLRTFEEFRVFISPSLVKLNC